MIRTLFLAAVVWGCTECQAASIGIYSAADCSGSASEVGLGDTVTLFVMADTNGNPFGGMTGAEYRIIGVPAGWQATSTPSPQAIISIGNPLAGGVNIVFPTAQAGCILLHTVTVHATSVAGNVSLEVVAHNNPSRPNFSCPWQYLPCDGPCTNPPWCADGVAHTLNSTVSTDMHTWGTVKMFYSQ